MIGVTDISDINAIARAICGWFEPRYRCTFWKHRAVDSAMVIAVCGPVAHYRFDIWPDHRVTGSPEFFGNLSEPDLKDKMLASVAEHLGSS